MRSRFALPAFFRHIWTNVGRVSAFGMRVVHSFSRHRMPTYAAALAYRGLLGLFPFALVGAFGLSDRLIEETRAKPTQNVPQRDPSPQVALQSISKVFVYGLALELCGHERVLARVGVEPSGDAFNSIVFDERNNRPFNPMVNAGALATTDLVADAAEPALERILDALRRYAVNEGLDVDEDIFEAEMRTADRNRATAYLMRSDGMLKGDVEATLALYLRQCAIVSPAMTWP